MNQEKFSFLLKRISESDEAAFEQLVSEYYGRLMGFAGSFIDQTEIAEELVMDAFMKLWQQRDSAASIRNLDTYCYVLVRNQALNYLRKSKNDILDLLEDKAISLIPFDQNPEKRLISEELLAQVNQAIDQLPPKCKMIFKLLREEQVSRKDAAEIINVSVKTIDAQMAIAVERIAKALNIDIKRGSNKLGMQVFMLCL